MIKITNINPTRFNLINDFLQLKLVSKSVFLAGGSLQTLVNPEIQVNDYDLFFTDEAIAKMLRKRLDVIGADCVFECPQGELYTYKIDDIKIQLITKFYYRNMEDLISSFDFRAAMFAYDGNTLLTTRSAIRDSIRKQVNINDVTFPVATLNRMIKYAARKGFTITHQAIDQFVRTVSERQYNEDQMVLYVD